MVFHNDVKQQPTTTDKWWYKRGTHYFTFFFTHFIINITQSQEKGTKNNRTNFMHITIIQCIFSSKEEEEHHIL